MRGEDRQALLDTLKDRYGNRSTNITTQLPTKAWHDYINDPTVANSICDRVVRNAYRIELKGASRRKEKAIGIEHPCIASLRSDQASWPARSRQVVRLFTMPVGVFMMRGTRT